MFGKETVGGGAAVVFAALALAAAGCIRENAWGWAWSAVFLVGFCAGVGYGVKGRLAGVVIDNRNRVSLSKLQALAWSVIVLSALLNAGITRVLYGASAPLDIDIKPELLAVMGISATSFVATPVILSLKQQQPGDANVAAATAIKLDDKSAAASGLVYGRSDPKEADWLDIFRGEEITNAASADLGKIQQFLITVIVLFVYAGAVWAMFATSDKAGASALTSLPPISGQMAWLIGISHAGYLAYKAAPH